MATLRVWEAGAWEARRGWAVWLGGWLGGGEQGGSAKSEAESREQLGEWRSGNWEAESREGVEKGRPKRLRSSTGVVRTASRAGGQTDRRTDRQLIASEIYSFE